MRGNAGQERRRGKVKGEVREVKGEARKMRVEVR